MRGDLDAIANAFDRRAPTYGRNAWHRACADELVARCGLRAGDTVFDAATGTGFAAMAAARRVGASGRVVAVDVSAGMLREAEAALRASALTNVELVQGDATSQPMLPDGSVDAVVCAAGLLYLDVAAALAEWRRLLRPGGVIACSTLAAGSPEAGRVFRICAAQWGITLDDPCAPLGTAARCRGVLTDAGFSAIEVTSGAVAFSSVDLSVAWVSNVDAPGHGAVRSLPPTELAALRSAYEEALSRGMHEAPEAFARASVLYAVGRRPS